MNKTLLGASSALALVFAQAAQAQDVIDLGEIIVSGGLTPVDADTYGRAVDVISSEDFERRGLTTVQNALRALPGVAVNSTGDSFTQVRIRGGEGNHVLVLIDGVEANSSGSGEYYFAGLDLANVERIEVLRGPQSALYGANAMSGVISIITKDAASDGFEYGFGGEVGGQKSLAANGFVRFANDRTKIALSAATRRTDGEDGSRTGGDTEVNNRDSLSFKLEHKLTDQVSAGLNLTQIRQEYGYDRAVSGAGKTPAQYVVDAPLTSKRDELYGSVWVDLDSFDGRLTHRLSFAGNRSQQDHFNAGVFSRNDEATRETFKLTGSYALDADTVDEATQVLSYALEREREEYAASFARGGNYTRKTDSIALEYQGEFDSGLSVQAGARHDLNDVFKDATTWSVSGAYQLPSRDIRLRASVGRAIVNPTMFEQFGYVPGSYTGNPNLKPEDSIGYELGADFGLGAAGDLSVTLFNNDVENLIQGTGATSVNVAGTSKRQGVELSYEVQANDWLYVGADYTYTKAEKQDGTRLVRRPEHELGLQLSADLFDGRGQATLDVRHVAGNYDLNWYKTVWPATASVEALADFTTVNVVIRYDLTDDVVLTGRIVNLTDSDASEAFGYYSQGRTAYVGVNATF
jgi:vitamin B12 transporter